MAAVERQWQVDGLTYAGLMWGPEDGIPLLALHGWMDHADSFQRLAPLLPQCRFIALDLSGHGKSDHRSADASYNLWDDLPQIVQLLDQWGWDECILLGHSRGGNIATLLAASQPERVKALITLDGIIPQAVEPKDFSKTLASFITQTNKSKQQSGKIFATPEDYIARRMAQGNRAEVALMLADRALQTTAQGHLLRADRRHFASSAVKLSQAQIINVLQSLSMPVLALWASEGAKYPAEVAKLCQAHIEKYQSYDVAGDHHFHMQEPARYQIAAHIERMIKDVW